MLDAVRYQNLLLVVAGVALGVSSDQVSDRRACLSTNQKCVLLLVCDARIRRPHISRSRIY
jgi:hypothetical protein